VVGDPGAEHIRVVAGDERIRLDAAGGPGVNMERSSAAGRGAGGVNVATYGVTVAVAEGAVAAVGVVAAGTEP